MIGPCTWNLVLTWQSYFRRIFSQNFEVYFAFLMTRFHFFVVTCTSLSHFSLSFFIIIFFDGSLQRKINRKMQDGGPIQDGRSKMTAVRNHDAIPSLCEVFVQFAYLKECTLYPPTLIMIVLPFLKLWKVKELWWWEAELPFPSVLSLPFRSVK